jgi:hypothetical protein
MRQVLLEGHPLHVFPCRADKTPACEHGFDDAVADQAGIDRLWSGVWARNRPALIGVATGVISGIAVIDIDPRRGGDRWFFENRDRLPKTRTHETQSFGQHLIYRQLPGLRCSKDQIAPGVEIKADGGYVIWWPSHGCRVLCEGPVAQFPRCVADELATPIIERAAKEANNRGDVSALVDVNGRVRLPRDLYLKAIRLCPLGPMVTRLDQRRLCGILSIVTRRTEHRNDGLLYAATAMRDLIGIIGRDTAIELLLDAARCNGYVAKDGVRAALATIRSGLAITETSPHFVDGDAA